MATSKFVLASGALAQLMIFNTGLAQQPQTNAQRPETVSYKGDITGSTSSDSRWIILTIPSDDPNAPFRAAFAIQREKTTTAFPYVYGHGQLRHSKTSLTVALDDGRTWLFRIDPPAKGTPAGWIVEDVAGIAQYTLHRGDSGDLFATTHDEFAGKLSIAMARIGEQ
jgi:hypothetical protein